MTDYFPDDRILSFAQKHELIKKSPSSKESLAAITSSARMGWALMVQARLLTMESHGNTFDVPVFDKRTLEGMRPAVQISLADLCVIVNEICQANTLPMKAKVFNGEIRLSTPEPQAAADVADVVLLDHVASIPSVQ